MQVCVAEDSACQGDLEAMTASLSSAQAALASCFTLLGSDPTAPGVLGAVAAALAAVEIARVWWRRYHGPDDPEFPLDRWVKIY